MILVAIIAAMFQEKPLYLHQYSHGQLIWERSIWSLQLYSYCQLNIFIHHWQW